MNTNEVAGLNRAALLDLGWTCTELEHNWQDGSTKFVCVAKTTGRMSTRRFLADGTLEVTRL